MDADETDMHSTCVIKHFFFPKKSYIKTVNIK